MARGVDFVKASVDCEGSWKRFEIRGRDYAIIDNDGDIAPINIVRGTDDGKDSQYADRISVVNLLNQLHRNSITCKENITVYDYLLNVERKLIILEKLIKEIDYVGRMNFNRNHIEEDVRIRRDEQFLVEVQNIYEQLFEDAYKSIMDIQKELGL